MKGLPLFPLPKGAPAGVSAVFMALILSLSPAAGGERKTHPRQNDFYAYSSAPASETHAAAPVHGSGCFVTLTAAEAARGVRHWRPGC